MVELPESRRPRHAQSQEAHPTTTRWTSSPNVSSCGLGAWLSEQLKLRALPRYLRDGLRTTTVVRDVVSLSLDTDRGCAVLKGGEIVCSRADDDKHVPTKVPGITNAVEVTVASTHACARTADARVLCWGGNGNGQLDDGTTRDRETPAPVVW